MGAGQIPLFGDDRSPRRPPWKRGSDAADPDGAMGSPAPGAPSWAGRTPEGPPSAAEAGPGGPAAEEPGPDGPEAEEPGRTPETAVSVSTLNATARFLLEGGMRPLWVAGEVVDWRRHGSGHCWFGLRDRKARLDCVMFRADARRLPTDPEEGMRVIVFGQASLYEERGRFQLVVRRLEARGEGLWRLAFERLRRKLAAEGLLDGERKRRVPRIPGRVGVVTSRTGAAVRDVVTVVRRRAPWTHVLVCDCRVQGDGAAAEICAALGRLGGHDGVDVIVLTRGGGSSEDLRCFNEESVARAIAACPVPVISAVGHEVDVTIADLVADLRAPTPSAAAELAVPDGAELRARVERMAGGLAAGLRTRARRGVERTRAARERLLGAMDRRLERWEARLARHADRLDALSPLGTLRRGYAVPLAEDGSVLRGIGVFPAGDRFRLRVVDGTVRCLTEGTEPAAPAPPGAAGQGSGDGG